MKFQYLFITKKLVQTAVFVFAAVMVCLGVYAREVNDPKKIWPDPDLSYIWRSGGPVKARFALSQDKVLVHSDGLVYMQVDLEADDQERPLLKKRTPTDFVIVLDRSGSMSGRNKMTFAQKAIESLLWQIGEEDRFALVAFDDMVETPIALRTMTSKNREELLSSIQSISPRGSTNLGAGLIEGMNILKNAGRVSGHAQRLILISDGMANEGITDVAELGRMAGGAVQHEFIISTIGVGLDFNETLLSSVADHGTGSYYFLEDVAQLDKILSEEFYGASRVLARNIVLKLDLASGFSVEEASGYPISQRGGAVLVQAGSLYEQQKKTFFVTLKVPTSAVYTEALGDVDLSYEANGTSYTVALTRPGLTIACLPLEKKEEVKRSVDQEIFTNAWTKNNYGLLLKASGGQVASGNLVGAKSSVQEYKNKLQEAYEVAPSPAIANQISELGTLEKEMDHSFTGADSEEKQKRLSKKLHFEGGKEQRVVK
ncbi:MAG: VWA domain-containing protein [Deltaproteobacteria bacterium]|nr:VWA domain-containing protein [Deltaproteobacteria bacterium]